MLQSDQAILHYDFGRQLVRPDRLTQGRHDHYLPAAERMLRIYQQGIGKTRQTLHRRVEDIMSRLSDCPPRRISAFCKLLDDASEFNKNQKQALALRRKLFALGAHLHPVVAQQEGMFETKLSTAQQRASEALGMPWEEIVAKAFADVVELQTLRQPPKDLTARALLSRYNVAQLQAALYKATHLQVLAESHFKFILRQAKLAGLMHRIERLQHRDRVVFLFDFDGPVSSLRTTWRYGIRYAQLIPSLLAIDGWTLQATIAGAKQGTFDLQLSADDGLKGEKTGPDEYDSELEKQILEAWQQSAPEGWVLEREPEILYNGQTVLTPDFVLRQRGNRRRFMVEVVGFWTPEYLADKAEKLAKFAASPTTNSRWRHWLLIVPRPNANRGAAALGDLKIPTLVIGKKFSPEELVRLAEASLIPDPTTSES